MPHRAACGRRGVNRFRQRPESHVPSLQVIQKADEVPQRAAQPVEFPDDKCLTFGERFETLFQLRPLDMHTRRFVGKDALASGLL